MARLVVVGMPEPRRRHEHRMRVPVKPVAVGHATVLVERLAHHRVATRLRVDYEVDRHRLMAVRGLHRPHRQQAKHRPHHVRDRHRLRKQAAAQEHAQPVGAGARGIADDRVERFEDRRPAIHRRRELRLPGLDAEVAEKRLVVHPVERRVFGRGMRRPAARGEREQVARMPRKLRAVGEPRRPAPTHHEEQVGGGVGRGEVGVARANVDEVGAEPRCGRRPDHPERCARIEGQRARGSEFVQVGPPSRRRHAAECAVGDRIGCVAIIVKTG